MNQEKSQTDTTNYADNNPETVGSILIVDDEVFIRDALQIYFETKGFEVHTAEDGEAALEIFSRLDLPIDVILLDLVLPGLHGVELLKIFKSKDPSVEVIIVTGCATMGTAVEVLHHGAFDYITKPIVDFDEDILKIVRSALKNRRQVAEKPVEHVHTRGDDSTEKLSFLERLVELACVANRYRQSEPILERIENLLRESFSMEAGIVLQRVQSGQFLPVYSWGFSFPLFPQSDHLPDSDVFEAVREGTLRFFPVTSLDASWLSIPSSDLVDCQGLACLPLAVQGKLWGSLIAIFASELPHTFKAPPERHPFQAMAPILSSIFSGSLKSLGI